MWWLALLNGSCVVDVVTAVGVVARGVVSAEEVT